MTTNNYHKSNPVDSGWNTGIIFITYSKQFNCFSALNASTSFDKIVYGISF